MSFLGTSPLILYYDNNTQRKEKDSLGNICSISYINSYIDSERASAFTSKGSITLEAALVVPIFFFAMLCMVYLMEITAIQTTVRAALHSVGKELAKEAYTGALVSDREIEEKIREQIGTERLSRSIIVGGSRGLCCQESSVNLASAEMELVVDYDLEIPVLMFRLPALSRRETLRVKGWTGYVTGFDIGDRESLVYITDYGLVYHKEKDCTYLELSIRSVNADEIEDLRNLSGGKYYPCSSCKKKTEHPTKLFITDYGERYHTSLECSKIKRNVYAVPLDEVYILGGCSKCVK